MTKCKTSSSYKKRRAVRNSRMSMMTVDSWMNNSRSCEGCTACCHVMGVKEISKPHFADCKHQCETGCSIYGKHPTSCKVYYCGWRSGVTTGERPDKSGILVDLVPRSGLVVVYEVRPGAFADPAARKIIDDLCEETGDVMVAEYGRTDHLRWWKDGGIDNGKWGTTWNIRLPDNVDLRTSLPLIDNPAHGIKLL